MKKDVLIQKIHSKFTSIQSFMFSFTPSFMSKFRFNFTFARRYNPNSFRDSLLKIDVKFHNAIKLALTLLFFILFILLPLFKFDKYKKQHEKLFYKNENLKNESEVIKKKLLMAKNSRNKKIEQNEKDKSLLVTKAFNSPTEIKLLMKELLDENKITITNIYRTETTDLSDDFQEGIEIHSIAIPYEIKGYSNDFFNFILKAESFEKQLVFNKHSISIESSKDGLISAKFYVSSISFSQEE